jgi:site-specific recombinase XerD
MKCRNLLTAPRCVKELLGHKNLDTLKHYTRLTITDLQKTHAKCHPREQDER